MPYSTFFIICVFTYNCPDHCKSRFCIKADLHLKKKKHSSKTHTHVAAHNNTQEKNRLIVIKIQTAANKEVIVGAPTSEHIAAVMQLTFEHQVSSMLNAAKVLEWILCASPLGFPKVTIITNWCKQTCPKFPQDNFPVTAAANYDVWWDNFLMRCPGED